MSAIEDHAGGGEDERLFPPLVSAAIVVGGTTVFGLLWLTDEARHTVLLTPVDTQLRAALFALGVFAGVWVAAVLREMGFFRTLGGGQVPEGVVVAFRLVMTVAAGGWCGFASAERATEWRAFHGLQASATREGFTVTGSTHHRRGADSLDLVGASGAPAISVSCLAQDCHGLGVGDRLLVTVETGRGGVRRAVFPGLVGGRGARKDVPAAG